MGLLSAQSEGLAALHPGAEFVLPPVVVVVGRVPKSAATAAVPLSHCALLGGATNDESLTDKGHVCQFDTSVIVPSGFTASNTAPRVARGSEYPTHAAVVFTPA
jgi:hypothetical protein